MAQRKFSPGKLQSEMRRLGVSKRELGRRFNPENPEGGRTHLISLLPNKGRGPIYKNPVDATVRRLADALGVTYEAITDAPPTPERVKRFFRLRQRQDERAA